jgi:hypothetical protein
MAQASEGQRKTKTKNKAKSASAERTQVDVSGRSRSSSLTQSEMARETSGLSQGVDLVRDDEGLEVGVESADDKGTQFSPDPAQEEAMGQIHGEEMHRRIAERAFSLYAAGGFQDGHDLDHWLEAERNIMTGH